MRRAGAKTARAALVATALCLLASTAATGGQQPQPAAGRLIERGELGSPLRSEGAISPDGKWLAFVADHEGTPNIFLAPRRRPNDAEPLTRDRGRGVRSFRFAFDDRHLLYTQDIDGDENDRLFAVDLVTRRTRALTPAGARAVVDTMSPRAPGAVVVMINDRDPKYFDPVRIDLATGRTTRLFQNQDYAAFVLDPDLRLRLASRYTDEGAKRWFLREGGGWRPWGEVPPQDAITTSILGFGPDDQTLYLADSRGRNTAAIYQVNLRTGARKLLAEDERVDLGAGLAHPVSGRIQAAARNYLRTEWAVIDPAIRRDMRTLRRLAGPDEFHVDSRTRDDRYWVVRVRSASASPRTYLYDRSSGRAELWFEGHPGWAALPLQPLHAVEVPSRDGLRLPGYYMLPAGADPDGDGVPAAPLPTVLWVHGGPWDRESYGFNPLFQLYANRGYAVLSVNFRGSTGFGKAFIDASVGEWGGRMQDDLLDAKAWAVRRGISRESHVAIVGGSYGGYAALAAMTMTPGAFACGISVAGPSSLVTLMDSIPEYWTSTRVLYLTRVGDPAKPSGRALLTARSPLTHASRTVGPLLIGQGANDPRVKRSEAEQMVRAMRANGAPVTYVLFPDEGHGFARPANDRAFSAVTEEFLARCLGGRAQPIGDDFKGSSITIPVGAEFLPRSAEALASARP